MKYIPEPGLFFESSGGVIYGPSGQEVLKVNVEGVLATEASELMSVLLKALNEHYERKEP